MQPSKLVKPLGRTIAKNHKAALNHNLHHKGIKAAQVHKPHSQQQALKIAVVVSAAIRWRTQ